jgi:phosphorylcholine metabolism protein LicD
VDFGTLLGIHRDKDIILGDNDGDVCIPISEEKKLLDALKNSGNYFIKWDRLHWPAFRTYNKNIFIDLYLVTIDTQNQVVKIPDSTVDTPLKFLSSFQNVTMPLGKEILTFRQPTDWTNLLIFRYGKKWTEHTCKWYLGYFSLLDTKNPRN